MCHVKHDVFLLCDRSVYSFFCQEVRFPLSVTAYTVALLSKMNAHSLCDALRRTEKNYVFSEELRRKEQLQNCLTRLAFWRSVTCVITGLCLNKILRYLVFNLTFFHAEMSQCRDEDSRAIQSSRAVWKTMEVDGLGSSSLKVRTNSVGVKQYWR